MQKNHAHICLHPPQVKTPGCLHFADGKKTIYMINWTGFEHKKLKWKLNGGEYNLASDRCTQNEKKKIWSHKWSEIETLNSA